MPVSGLSTGIDFSIVVFDPNTNAPLSFGRITGFDRKQNVNKLKSDAINGPPIFGNTYDGWSGTFRVERNGPNADQFFALLEENYFNGVAELTGYILETVKENVGYTQWRYDGTVFQFSDAGNVDQKTFIKMTVTWEASRRRRAN